MEITRPTNLAEALEARASDPGADLLAGGTDLMVEVNFGFARPDSVIALRRIDELAEVSDKRIGAGVTWARLEESRHRALAQLSRTVGSPGRSTYVFELVEPCRRWAPLACCPGR